PNGRGNALRTHPVGVRISGGAPLRNWACQNPPFLRSKRRRALRRSSLFEPMMRISFASTSTRSRERAQVVAAVAAALGTLAPAADFTPRFERSQANV